MTLQTLLWRKSLMSVYLITELITIAVSYWFIDVAVPEIQAAICITIHVCLSSKKVPNCRMFVYRFESCYDYNIIKTHVTACFKAKNRTRKIVYHKFSCYNRHPTVTVRPRILKEFVHPKWTWKISKCLTVQLQILACITSKIINWYKNLFLRVL